MTPLTVDCARVRQLLPDLLEPPTVARPTAGPPTVAPPAVAPPAVAPDDRAFAEDHLRGCPGCAEAREQIAEALRALEHLSPADVARLRALADAEPDARPLARLAAACVGLVVLAVLGAVVRLAPGPGAAPAAPAAPAPAAWSPATFGALAVGAEVGIEVEPDLLPPPIELPAPTPPEPAPEPIAVAEAPPPPAPVAAPPPAPVAAAPVAAAPIGAPAPADPAPRPGRVDPPPPPPPAEVAALLGRLQLSDGARYRGVTFFFARDPAARDRLGRARVPALPTVREAAPPEPERCVVRPPDGAGSYRVLAGELLEAPCGLRLASRPQRIGGRVELPVTPAGFDALAAIEGRARREPLLRAPLIAPSRVRAAMIAGGEPGPVAVLLEVMADPTLQFDRLRRELARLEPEARDLERRLRGLLEDERGLRAVAVSIRGVARTVDVFASSRDLADALPRLLRAALLEAALEAPDELAAVGMDPRSAGIELGVKETRERHEALLAALLDVRGRADADGVFERTGPNDAAALWLAGAELLQATAVVR